MCKCLYKETNDILILAYKSAIRLAFYEIYGKREFVDTLFIFAISLSAFISNYCHYCPIKLYMFAY